MAKSMKAKQIIYTRVEKDYSPTGRSGYQPVYCSKDVSDSDIATIKKHVGCFQTSASDLQRHQFFTLPSGEAVVTYTVLLEHNHPLYRTYIDRDGREGVFLAHALIIPQRSFQEMSYNPFYVLDNASFLENMDELVALISQAGDNYQDVPRKTVTIKSASSLDFGWSQSDLKTLYILALNSARTKRSVALVGETEKIRETLRLLIRLLEPHHRQYLTFTTSADDCTFEPGLFWGQGVTKRIRPNEREAVINTAEHTVSCMLKDWEESEDLYSNWLLSALEIYDYDQLLNHSKIASNLSQAFKKDRPQIEIDWIRNQDADVLESFFTANDTRMKQLIMLTTHRSLRVNQQITTSFSSYLYKTQAKSWLIQYACLPANQLQIVLEEFIAWMFKIPTQSFSSLFTRDDWQTLIRISREPHESIFQFWMEATSEDPRINKLRSMSKKLPERYHQYVLSRLFDPIYPTWLIPYYGSTSLVAGLVEHEKLDQIEFEDFYTLIEALSNSRLDRHLDKFVGHPLILTLNYKELEQLYRLLDKHNNTGTALGEYIEDCWDTVEKPRSVIGSIASLMVHTLSSLPKLASISQDDYVTDPELDEEQTQPHIPQNPQDERVSQAEETYISPLDEMSEKHLETRNSHMNLEPDPMSDPDEYYGPEFFDQASSHDEEQQSNPDIYAPPLPIENAYDIRVDDVHTPPTDLIGKDLRSEGDASIEFDYLGTDFVHGSDDQEVTGRTDQYSEDDND